MCLFDFNYFFHYGGLKKYLYEVCISLYMYVLFLDMHIKVENHRLFCKFQTNLRKFLVLLQRSFH